MELFDLLVWTEAAGDFLLNVIIAQGIVFAALIVGFGFGLRRASAAMRSIFWAAGAGALLIFPWIAHMVPHWELGLARFPAQLFRTEGVAAQGLPAIPEISWLVLAWLAGSALFAGRLLLHVLRIGVATRRAEPVRGRLATLANSLAADLGLSRVRVVLGDAEGVPLTWGLRRPVVVLPVDADRWPEDLQAAVLRHEMAHIERRDYAGLILLELCRILHWPNPIVWHLVRRGRMDQELACDDVAIRSGIDPSRYAGHLVAVARAFLTGSPTPVGALPVLGASPLATRVQAAMERRANRNPLTLRAALVAFGLIVLTAIPAGATNLWACPYM